MTAFEIQEIQKKLAILIQEGSIGETVVLETLVQTFGGLIYRLANEILSPHEVPDETIQSIIKQVFIDAFQNPDGLNGKDTIQTWLYADTLRACRALQKKHKLVKQPEDTLPAWLTRQPQKLRSILILRYAHS